MRGAKGSLTVENVLFAGSNTFQIFYDDKTLPASLNWSKVYRTSDLTVSNQVLHLLQLCPILHPNCSRMHLQVPMCLI